MTVKSPLREYHRNMLLVMIAYTGSVVGINLLETDTMGATMRTVLSLIPIVPAALMIAVILHYVRQIDEVQQRIITEACLVSLVTVGLASFTYGFLEGAIALPAISMIWVFPALIGTAGLALPIIRLRYV